MFFSKVLQMAAIMIIFNISNLCYNVFISEKAGPEGVGLFHLIMNVHSIGVSLSVSGMSLTATRLLSDMPRSIALTQASSIIGKCLRVCMVTASFAAIVMFAGADFIAEKLLGHPECALCLKILAPSLLGIALSSVMSGYFTAFGKVGTIGVGKLCAELVNWGITIAFIDNAAASQICHVVVTAGALSIAVQCVCDMIMCAKSVSSHPKKTSTTSCKDVIKLCAPLALGSYLRTGLSSAENLLIPVRLSAGGVNNSLSKYGTLKGMSMPVMMFPSVFAGAFSALIVPEIARRFSQKHMVSIKYISSLSVEYILKFAIMISAILYAWADEICSYFFSFSEAGDYLHLLAMLPVFMFLDSVTDAILKGLNEQVFGLKVNIADSVMRVVLIFVFVPYFKIEAYIAILYISEFLNLTLSFWKLKKTTALRFPLGKAVIIPLFSVWCAFGATNLLNPVSVAAKILIFAAVYIAIAEISSPVIQRETK